MSVGFALAEVDDQADDSGDGGSRRLHCEQDGGTHTRLVLAVQSVQLNVT